MFLKSTVCWRCTRTPQASHLLLGALTWKRRKEQTCILGIPYKDMKRPANIPKTWQISEFGGGVSFLPFFLGEKNHKQTYFWIKSFPFCPPQKACVTQHSAEVLQCSFNLWRDRVSTSRDRCSNPRKKIKSNAYLCLPLGFIKMNPISVSDPLLKSREALHFDL